MSEQQTVLDQLNIATQALQAGHPEKSTEICEAILSQHKGMGNALHVLALSQRAQGKIHEAESTIRRAVKKLRKDPRVLNSYGLILLDAGKISLATQALQKALKVDGTLAAAHANLGHALARQKKTEKAKDSYRKALRIDPRSADAFVSLGLLLRSENEYEEIESLLAAHEPTVSDESGFHFLRGVLFLDRESLADAEAVFREGLLLAPQSYPLLINLGVVLIKQGRKTEALEVLDNALAVNPLGAEAHLNIADAYKYDHPKKSRKHLDQALTLNPQSPNALDLLGFTWFMDGEYDKAIQAFDSALSLDENFHRAYVHKAAALFMAGRLEEGWSNYLKVYGSTGVLGSPFGDRLPLASAAPSESHHTLIWTDQGIGDEILQLGMVTNDLVSSATATLAVSKRLVPLAARSFPGFKCISRETAATEQIPNSAGVAQLPCARLGMHTRKTFEEFPGRASYLIANESEVESLKRKYRAMSQGRPIIGLSWKSANPEFGPQKSVPLQAFETILKREDFFFLNLQYGDSKSDTSGLTADIRNRFIDDPDIDPTKDLDSFAAQLCAVDITVSVSNSTVHLSGALGQPTCALIPKPGPGWLWYWFADRPDSPWYPSVTLYRQDSDGDWASAIAAIEQHLVGFFPV